MRSTMLALLPMLAAVSYAAPATSAENPNCAPGGNLDLTVWELEIPTGTQGNPDTISSSRLQGCGGYQNTNYFFTESGDGATVMKAPSYPSSNCIKYGGSKHCRTEFHEVNPNTGSNQVSWSPGAAKNRLYVDLAGQYGESVCIGQVFQADGNPDHNKPLCEVYYNKNGDITIGIEATPTGGTQGQPMKIGNVPRGTRFNYELRYEGNQLKMQVNNAGLVHLDTQFTPSGCFFKMGNYNQGGDAADIHLYNLAITH